MLIIKLSWEDDKKDAYQEFHSTPKGVAIVRRNAGLLSSVISSVPPLAALGIDAAIFQPERWACSHS